MDEKLKKGIKDAILGALLATSPGLSSQDAAKEPPKIEQIKFDPHSLHSELHPIAHLESSFGQNMKHKPSARGEMDTAVGALGLKPSTGFDTYLKSPHLQKLFPHLEDSVKFRKELIENPLFYNTVSGEHWNKLKKLTGSTDKAAFAWRWGQGAVSKVSDDAIQNDNYVKKYKKMAAEANPIVAKNEDLDKGIGDIKPGKLSRMGGIKTVSPKKIYNYDHLLSPQHVHNGYSLEVHDSGPQAPGEMNNRNMISVLTHDGDDAGEVYGYGSPALKNKMTVSEAHLDDPHRGQGLGKIMYEALYAHGKHKAGINEVHGGIHSTMASRVHQSLAQKHGLSYKPQQLPGTEHIEPGPYDSKFGAYSFKLSEQDLDKALTDIPVAPETVLPTGNTGHDYTHRLPPEAQKAGLLMHVRNAASDSRHGDKWIAEIRRKVTSDVNDKLPIYDRIGVLEGRHNPKNPSIFNLDYSRLGETAEDKELRGKGIGNAMYETLLAHAKNHLGATRVSGGKHSTLASKVHSKISEKHGLDYKPEPTIPASGPHAVADSALNDDLHNPVQPVGAFDDRFKPYEINLKYEQFDKSFNEWNSKKVNKNG